MSGLNKEFQNLFNPALGAAILFKFSEGYLENENKGTPLPILYIVLPLIFQEQSFKLLADTQTNSGMRKFVNKFFSPENSMTDVLLSFPKRVEEMRDLSKRSLQMALMSNILILIPDQGIVFPNSQIRIDIKLSTDVEKMLKAAKKLGIWCTELSLFEVGNLFKVEF